MKTLKASQDSALMQQIHETQKEGSPQPQQIREDIEELRDFVTESKICTMSLFTVDVRLQQFRNSYFFYKFHIHTPNANYLIFFAF